MRILVNALSARQGGGQTYLVNLLARIPPESDAEVLLLAPEGLALGAQGSRVRRLDAGPRTENPLVRALWERTRLPRLLKEQRIDVLFSPGGVQAPASDCRTVTMFRNMIPFDMEVRRRYPLGYARLRNWLLERLMLRSMERADLTIFLADYAKEVIARASKRAVRSPVVIPHGVSEAFFASGAPRPGWVPPSYILYASTIDVYKAQLEVVAGFARALPKLPAGMRLLLVGHEYPPYAARVRREIARLGMSDHVLVPGPARYADMPALYRHAEVNIFASECENCPNILLETLAAGRPVLCSSKPPMPEFGGDAVLYFDPRSPRQLAERLEQVFTDPALRARLAESAVKRARGYSWDESARRTWDAIFALGAPRTTRR